MQKLERLAEDVMQIELKLPRGENFAFRASQYIDILLADGQRRSFSIANALHDSGHLEAALRRIDGGRFTGHIFETMMQRRSCASRARSAASSCARTPPGRS